MGFFIFTEARTSAKSNSSSRTISNLKLEAKNKIMNTRQQQLQAFNRLLDIMDDLREKCPWDKKQTLESLRHLTIEETYELGDAISESLASCVSGR